jgi:hypothetical protein
MNGFLLKASMLVAADATMNIAQNANGDVAFKLGTVGISNITNLQTTINGLTSRIDSLEQGSIDLSNYTAPAGIKLSTTDAAFEIVATSLTLNGKAVALDEKFANYQATAEKNAANGYAGLDANSKLTASQLPIDTATLEIAGGVLKVKTAPVVNTFTASAVVEGVPTVTGTPEVGDLVSIASGVETYGGNVYYRNAATTGKLDDDYTLMTYKFDANMDSITQGTNNKFLNATEYGIVSKFSIDEQGLLKYDNKTVIDSAMLDPGTFDMAGGMIVTLADGGVAFSKLAQTGAVPSGWTVAASQITGLDAALNNVVKTVSVTGPDALTASVTGTALTIELALTGDITSSESGLAVNAGTGVGQFLKFTTAGVLPAVSGANLTALNASNIASGTLNAARLPVAGSTAATKGAVYVAADQGISLGADGALSLAAKVGSGITGAGTTASPLAVDTSVVATKASVDALTARVVKLEQEDIPFTATNVADGVLTVEAMLCPRGICKADGSNLIPVFPDTRTLRNGEGKSTFTINIGTSFVVEGNWLVVF